MIACSSPTDCAELERRLAAGRGLLANGGTSRGNLLSGEAEETILTVSRVDAERRANPGYRAFLANGFNVTRAGSLLLGGGARTDSGGAGRPARRSPTRPARRRLPAHASGDVRDRSRPDRLRRAHGRAARTAGGVRHLLELRRGGSPFDAEPTRWRPCASSTSSSGASSGRGATPRAPTSSSYSPITGRPRVRPSNSGMDMASRSSSSGLSSKGKWRASQGDEQHAMVETAVNEATGRHPEKRAKNDVSDREVVVLGSATSA